MSITLETPDELYADMRKHIDKTIRKYQRKHGGDFDELLDRANELYMEAYERHDSKRGKFSSWVIFLIGRMLVDDKRKEAMRAKRLKRNYIEMDLLTQQEEASCMLELLDCLSDDARHVVNLTLKGSPAFRIALGCRIHGSPRNVRSALREVLTDEGWNADRINQTFDEIRDQLI